MQRYVDDSTHGIKAPRIALENGVGTLRAHVQQKQGIKWMEACAVQAAFTRPQDRPDRSHQRKAFSTLSRLPHIHVHVLPLGRHVQGAQQGWCLEVHVLGAEGVFQASTLSLGRSRATLADQQKQHER